MAQLDNLAVWLASALTENWTHGAFFTFLVWVLVLVAIAAVTRGVTNMVIWIACGFRLRIGFRKPPPLLLMFGLLGGLTVTVVFLELSTSLPVANTPAALKPLTDALSQLSHMPILLIHAFVPLVLIGGSFVLYWLLNLSFGRKKQLEVFTLQWWMLELIRGVLIAGPLFALFVLAVPLSGEAFCNGQTRWEDCLLGMTRAAGFTVLWIAGTVTGLSAGLRAQSEAKRIRQIQKGIFSAAMSSTPAAA